MNRCRILLGPFSNTKYLGFSGQTLGRRHSRWRTNNENDLFPFLPLNYYYFMGSFLLGLLITYLPKKKSITELREAAGQQWEIPCNCHLFFPRWVIYAPCTVLESGSRQWCEGQAQRCPTLSPCAAPVTSQQGQLSATQISSKSCRRWPGVYHVILLFKKYSVHGTLQCAGAVLFYSAWCSGGPPRLLSASVSCLPLSPPSPFLRFLGLWGLNSDSGAFAFSYIPRTF